MPATISVDVTVPTLDNIPNRFVKHVLDHFLRLLNRVRDTLTKQPESPSALRGMREIAEIERRLEVLRSAPIFRDEAEAAEQKLLRSGIEESYADDRAALDFLPDEPEEKV